MRLSGREDITREQIQAVPCPTCGAEPREECELNSGGPRTESHRDRRLAAEESLSVPIHSELMDELDRIGELRKARNSRAA
jgi:hypothetical protein